MIIFSSCKKEENDLHNYLQTYFTCDGDLGTYDNSTLISKDNNIIICGNGNKGGICLLKISKAGTLIWKNEFKKGSECSASAIAENNNGEIFVCGYMGINLEQLNNVFIVKISATGDTIWTRRYSTPHLEYGQQIINTSDAKLLICATYDIPHAANTGIALKKIDYNGDTIWTKTFDNTDGIFPYHLLETENGEYFMTGTYDNTDSGRELYFLKLDQNGNKLWDKKIGPAWRWGYCTIELSNGNFLTCGSQYTFGNSQIMLIKTDESGNPIWEKEYGTGNLSYFGSSMKLNLDGTITITGSLHDPIIPQDDLILLKTDQDGTLLWLKSYGDPKVDERGYNLVKDVNDDNIVTGTKVYSREYENSNLTNTFSRVIYMMKFTKDGNFK